MKFPLPHDYDEDLDSDAVWTLLDDSPPADPSPTFVQDTLRRARLEADAPSPWWQKLISPKALWGTATAACAAVALMFLLNTSQNTPSPSTAGDDPPVPTEEWNDLEDALADALLVGASEDPSLLSDEEIVALLF